MAEEDRSGGSVCSRCGARFECGVEAGAETCWCFEEPPVSAVVRPGGDGASCLCPECLRAVATAASPAAGGPER